MVLQTTASYSLKPCDANINIILYFTNFYTVAIKILTLDVEGLNEDFFRGTRLLTITAPIKKHLFCWQLNNLFGLDFKLCSEKEIPIKKKNRNYFFSIYHSIDPNNPSLEYILYHTQHDGEYLLPEFKHTDFLWLIRGDIMEEEQLNWLKQNIKTINGVQLVAELTPEQIKSKGNLVFDV